MDGKGGGINGCSCLRVYVCCEVVFLFVERCFAEGYERDFGGSRSRIFGCCCVRMRFGTVAMAWRHGIAPGNHPFGVRLRARVVPLVVFVVLFVCVCL